MESAIKIVVAIMLALIIALALGVLVISNTSALGEESKGIFTKIFGETYKDEDTGEIKEKPGAMDNLIDQIASNG